MRIKVDFNRVSDHDISRLEEIVGHQHVIADTHLLEAYGRDETEALFFQPEVAVKPATAEEIVEIVRYARARRLPITPRGAGTGLSGGALPVAGGIVLSVERMNRILEIDPVNMMAVVQPGVITADLQEAVEARGLFYPPDPASRRMCFIGGNVAENAGGPRALKYGVTREYVSGLEAVLGTGEKMKLGGKLYKNVAGYDLLHLMVGSEGTLGIFTEVVLKLIPLPACHETLVVPFPEESQALKAIPMIFRERILPSALEFIGREALRIATRRIGPLISNEATDGMLLIQLDGDLPEVVDRMMERVGEVVLKAGASDVYVADSPRREAEIWDWRRRVAEAVKHESVYREEDAVVPRHRLTDLISLVHELDRAYGLLSACYGHAGDGNVHINILKRDLDDATWQRILPEYIERLFRQVVHWGGSITGEHGVGWIQRNYLPLMYGEVALAIMKAVKRVCDPDGILNPLKVFPD